MNLIEHADREMLAMRVADVLAAELRKCLLAHDFASLVVPGGSTPGPIFDTLSGVELDWARVRVMLSDERWVAEDHEMSNAALIRARLLTGPAAAARFIPFHRPGLDARAGAAEVAPALAENFPISVLMLGMGADMHTASLFPGADGMATALANDAPNLCAVTIPGQEIARVTLPAHLLENAMSKNLVIYGEEKRAALERARGLTPQEAPIRAVMSDLTVHWAA